MQKLVSYFTDGIVSQTLQTVGAEIETQFVDKDGRAVQTQTSQQMLSWLVENGWNVDCRKGNLIATLVDHDGNKIFYELGRHNMEVSTIASTQSCVLGVVRECLTQLYEAADRFGANPYSAPVLDGNEDLLVIPDERDAIWLELDGRDAIAPLMFESLTDYCRALTQHDVVREARLVPYQDVSDLDIPLYLRSIWWHFRLKRYGNTLCVEVRPMARRTDDQFNLQLERVLQIIFGERKRCPKFEREDSSKRRKTE